MPALRKKADTPRTHAARRPAAKPAAKKGTKKGSRTKKRLSIRDRINLKISGWKESLFSYKYHAMIGGGLFGFLALYIALAAGFGTWLADEVDDRTRASLVAVGLSVEQIRVEGRNRADLDDVRKAIGIIQGDSILHYDIEGARERLEKIEWIEDARVIRFLPRTIHVVLRERSPVAIWQLDGKLQLVDARGTVIDEFSDKVAADLPLIVGPGAPQHASDLFATLAGYPTIRDNFAAAIRVADRRWNIRLTNGVEINLPADNIQVALARIVKYDDENDLLRQEIKSIDMRLPDRVYLRLTDEEADKLWSERTKT